jgi:hypothetical protein
MFVPQPVKFLLEKGVDIPYWMKGFIKGQAITDISKVRAVK